MNIKNILLNDPEITFITVPGPFDLAPGHSAVFTDIGYHVIEFGNFHACAPPAPNQL